MRYCAGVSNARVAVIEDDRAVRDSVADMLMGVGYRVSAFGSAEEFLACDNAPDGTVSCLVVDVHLPAASGVELQRRLVARGRAVPTVFVTGYDDVPTTVAAMKGGAIDFLLKPVSASALLSAVRSAVEQGALTLGDSRVTANAAHRLARLTPREREVFTLVSRGLLNKQIAAQLGVSMATVKAHRGRLTRKLSVSTVADLVRLADRVSLALAHVDLGGMAADAIPA